MKKKNKNQTPNSNKPIHFKQKFVISFQLLQDLNISIPLTLNKHILDPKTETITYLMIFFKRSTRTSTYTALYW